MMPKNSSCVFAENKHLLVDTSLTLFLKNNTPIKKNTSEDACLDQELKLSTILSIFIAALEKREERKEREGSSYF